MGLSSNLRKSAVKRSKEQSFRRPKKKQMQKRIQGGNAEPRCDDPVDPKTCEMCLLQKHRPNAKNMAHDPTCKRNKDYHRTNGGRISLLDVLKEEEETKRLALLNKPIVLDEMVNHKVDHGRVDRNIGGASQHTTWTNKKAAKTTEGKNNGLLCAERLKLLIKKKMENPSKTMTKKKSEAVPMVVAAAFEVLLETTQAIQFPKDSNALEKINKNTKGYQCYQTYRQHFQPGTIGFTFPPDDKCLPPDYYYNQLEGRTLYFARWELNIPGIKLGCFASGCAGEMIHREYDYQAHGFLTPLYRDNGSTDYAGSMQYCCNKCGIRCKATDGRLLATLPMQFRNAYPVDPRYTVNKKAHLDKHLSRKVDKLMLTHGNGEQLSQLLNELRGDYYLDRQEEYFQRLIDTNTACQKAPPTFEESIGNKFGLSGAYLRNLKDEASRSTLNSTGVSDYERVMREIQAVGCKVSVSSDHTFEVNKNYCAYEIDGAFATHVITVEDGQVASAVLVQNTKQEEYAHQAEQFALRPNVSPMVHFSDTCPNGTAFWKKLFRNVKCQLGWFHFLQRITKTLNKEHADWKQAIAELSECVYWRNPTDVAKVERCIQDGVIGRSRGRDGKLLPCPRNKIKEKAKKFRENIRVYSYPKEKIEDNLAEWARRWQGEFDEAIGQYLFNDDTERTVNEQIKKTEYVVDQIDGDLLYTKLLPGKGSESKLDKFVGNRGVESKGEKSNHLIAHFANGNMRRSMADYLNMEGTAKMNLRIRQRRRMAELDPKGRAKVPVAFHGVPHFTNHLRLSLVNVLARKAGLGCDVHQDVEVLQPDNGERFFSEYLFEQKERTENNLTASDDVNRCGCKLCKDSRVEVWNPYRRIQPGVNPNPNARPITTDHQVALGISPPEQDTRPPEENSNTQTLPSVNHTGVAANTTRTHASPLLLQRPQSGYQQPSHPHIQPWPTYRQYHTPPAGTPPAGTLGYAGHSHHYHTPGYRVPLQPPPSTMLHHHHLMVPLSHQEYYHPPPCYFIDSRQRHAYCDAQEY